MSKFRTFCSMIPFALQKPLRGSLMLSAQAEAGRVLIHKHQFLLVPPLFSELEGCFSMQSSGRRALGQSEVHDTTVAILVFQGNGNLLANCTLFYASLQFLKIGNGATIYCHYGFAIFETCRLRIEEATSHARRCCRRVSCNFANPIFSDKFTGGRLRRIFCSIDLQNFHPKPGHSFTLLFEHVMTDNCLDSRLDCIGGYRKSDTTKATRSRHNGCIYSHNFALEVQQRAARIP